MDLFRFTNKPSSPTKMESGEIINGLKTKMWIERYREAGEFELTAKIDSGVRAKLPIGSFISHSGTSEIMIVENHEISENSGEVSDIKITGRGFETFFENRIVGSNINPSLFFFDNNKDYILANDYTWAQAITLFNNHLGALNVFDSGDIFQYLDILSQVSLGRVAQRKVPKGSLYDAIISLLEIEDLGLKIVRPGVWSPEANRQNVWMIIHKGVDRRSTVTFSYLSGDIESADYFWSNRTNKTMAFVMGTWLQARTVDDNVQYDRRIVAVDGSDIDANDTVFPSGARYTEVLQGLRDRGQDVLDVLKNIALTKVDASKVSTNYIFRKDYEVGDLVTVNGNYDTSTVMRVNEFVEIEDENGEKGYPTLTVEG